MKKNVIFCPSLPEAFASVAMVYPEHKDMPAGKWSRFSTNGEPANMDGWCNPYPDGAGACFGCKRENVSFVWQRRDHNARPLTTLERQDACAKSELARSLRGRKIMSSILKV